MGENVMDQLNIIRIIQHLWSNPAIRLKIEADYSLVPFTSSDTFATNLTQALKQPVRDIYREVSNNEVFEAAVKALGSNSRQWGTFSSKEDQLKDLLEGYNPIKVSQKWNDNYEEQIKDFFPGQTRKNDVTAVFQWSKKLTQLENFYERCILDISNAFSNRASQRGVGLTKEQLLLLVCGFSANPSNSSIIKLTKFVSSDYKFYGMGYILASEFLRNLGWNGFKPDRHIKRLFDHWYSSNEEFQQIEISLYTELLSSRKKDLIEFVRYSLMGHKITPKNLTYSEMDNLLWAFGSYVAKKGKENQFPIFE